MAEGMSTALASAILNALCNATPWHATGMFIQLHTGPPGAAGTNAIAPGVPRIAVSFAVVTGQTAVNDAAVTWTNVQGAADPTHFSLWDFAAAGTFHASGTIDSAPYAVGNTLNIPSGALTVSFTVAT
jgi:hypothetical protein